MKTATWIGLFLVAAVGMAQAPDVTDLTATPPRVLTATGQIDFGIPMFGSVGETACDASGDMVFNVGTGITQMGPFLGVNSDGTKHVLYALPKELGSFGDLAWAVSPRGVFYVLHSDAKAGYKLVRFADDGSVDQVETLDIPFEVQVRRLAVADNGTMLLVGYLDTREPLSKARAGFAKLLDASGKMIRDLSADIPQTDLNAAQKHPLDGDVASGEDGRFYILREKDILVVNQAGETERKIGFTKPVSDGRALQIAYSKGLVSILFFSIHRSSPREPADVKVRAILLNAQTGAQLGDYAFDPATTGNVLCFNAQKGYTLMAVDDSGAAMDIVPVR